MGSKFYNLKKVHHRQYQNAFSLSDMTECSEESMITCIHVHDVPILAQNKGLSAVPWSLNFKIYVNGFMDMITMQFSLIRPVVKVKNNYIFTIWAHFPYPAIHQND